MRPMVIISGGQTGADQGGLAGASLLGIKTAGWMPRGFLTERGPRPDLAALYGLREMKTINYPERTKRNIWDSDGTVWIDDGRGVDSRGFRCTEKWAKHLERPFIKSPTAEQLRYFIKTYSVVTLNVAGPRASRDYDAYRRAKNLIIQTFREV